VQKHCRPLRSCGAVDAGVGHSLFPVEKKRFCSSRLANVRPRRAFSWT
jgi:hypothetical protein